ncbi:stage IV sporulation protein A [Intestinibacter bartlettii]|uniref:Stage IV sporulation protein A n=2 Tax=Intestinibacter bartlettii TaxID=261299 RepID=A0ABS8CZB4_9FIRM|nr:stage IV sporulation protein A [Intestinibacter bartlettii]MBS7147018.1 stage IV sporulation protein A [Intestinibacter bartlettii]MCB5397740.1 stage IV sporulation protein A [Intestinibacter bartlettii]MCB5405056.1 stage IV sporulation protein A [Intestinibacter bartlettii]MCB5446552.1 stage IV sporulation protein A [Intestinibacter bartlettii]MCB5749279.1 stage IV sporulation protein A [Intestinibacter bartlettii]
MRMNIYEDIAKRTQGDIYIGVVGPVRTGKSTFIRKFMETLVLPNIENEFKRDRTRDEIPQSGSGKTIMTVEPKFVPADGVVIQLKDSVSLKVRMVDCVGYIVEGALGHEENGKQRLVSTPWSKDAMTFEEAAEIGTKKVIRDHSTIGVVVITDGSVTGIERGSYIEAEERVIDELKSMNKPFVVILNSLTPKDEKTEILRNELEEKYEVPILPVNVEQMEEPDIENILETVLYDFPLNEIRINISKWVEGLEKNHWIKESIISTLKQCIANLQKIRDIDDIVNGFENLEFLDGVTVENVELGEGVVNIQLSTKQELFYNVLEEKSGFKIEEDSQLLNLVTTLSKVKQEYDKIEVALNDAKNFGYGVVAPSLSELSLEEPEIIKQGKQYGVKLKANAPSLHIIKADISTEVSPIVGNQNQGEEMVKYLLNEFEQNPSEIWESNMFGKSLNDLVKEQLQSKLYTMPDEIRFKIQKTLQKIINEGSNNIITIIL